jgi:hypothetical protein
LVQEDVCATGGVKGGQEGQSKFLTWRERFRASIMTVRVYFFIIIMAIVSSCNRQAAIILTNQSLVDKNVRVTYPAGFAFLNYQDSLQAWDLANTQNAISVRDRYRYSLKLPVATDPILRTVSFTLKAGHEVTVLGSPTHVSTIRKTVILAGDDTLNYRKQNACWVFLIR